jgi:hypothetical protein
VITVANAHATVVKQCAEVSLQLCTLSFYVCLKYHSLSFPLHTPVSQASLPPLLGGVVEVDVRGIEAVCLHVSRAVSLQASWLLAVVTPCVSGTPSVWDCIGHGQTPLMQVCTSEDIRISAMYRALLCLHVVA